MAQENREGESTLIPYYPQNNGNTLKVLEKNCKKKKQIKLLCVTQWWLVIIVAAIMLLHIMRVRGKKGRQKMTMKKY